MTEVVELHKTQNGTVIKETRFYKNGNLVAIDRFTYPVAPQDFVPVTIILDPDRPPIESLRGTND